MSNKQMKASKVPTRYTFFVFIAILFFQVFATKASAQWNKLEPRQFKIQNFPTDNSPEDIADIKALLNYQATRTQADCRFAESQNWGKVNSLFNSTTVAINANELKQLEPVLTKAMNALRRITDYYKEEFLRPRPYNRDSRLRPCIQKPGGEKSYPSHHAAAGILGACLLKEHYPDLTKELSNYGLRIGELRAIVGVHHLSDVKAGQDLGLQVCTRLIKDPGFRKEFGL